MISTAITLIGLLGLFLLGIKWAMDLVREWPRKGPMSSYFEQQHSMRNSAESKSSTQKLDEVGHVKEPSTSQTCSLLLTPR